jgi:hypothetical protein
LLKNFRELLCVLKFWIRKRILRLFLEKTLFYIFSGFFLTGKVPLTVEFYTQASKNRPTLANMTWFHLSVGLHSNNTIFLKLFTRTKIAITPLCLALGGLTEWTKL